MRPCTLKLLNRGNELTGIYSSFSGRRAPPAGIGCITDPELVS